MFKEKVKDIITAVKNSYISEYAAQCSYFIILSFIPFVILLLTLIQYLGLNKETLITIFESIIPSDINDKVLDIIQEVYSKSIGTVSVSIVFTLWAAGKGFFALCKGLNSIYVVRKKDNYLSLRIRSIICTIGFILIIVITLVFLVFGTKINIWINIELPKVAKITNIFMNFSNVIVFTLLFFTFIIIYKFVPKHKAKIKYQLPGALFTAAGWLAISNLISLYLVKFSGFSVMYGSLTTVMLLFIWIYLCMYILFLGAIINREIEKGKIK